MFLRASNAVYSLKKKPQECNHDDTYWTNKISNKHILWVVANRQ